MAGQRNEIALAASMGAKFYGFPEGYIQGSYLHQVKKLLDIGVVGAAGCCATGYGSFGLILRPRFETRIFAMGFQAEGGFLWGGFQLPIAVRLTPRVWIHASAGVRGPGFASPYFPSYGSPVWIPAGLGFEFRISNHYGVTGGWTAGFATTDPSYHAMYGTIAFNYRFNRRQARTKNLE